MACAGAVITGIAACRAEGELSWTVAGGSIALVVVGMVLAYRTRRRPLPWIKPILAMSAVAAFVWFFRQLTGQTIYDVSTVENPLAVLFVWVQVAHAFDVPARRDLAFSLAGSASLMAVAAAQAIDLAFGVYVLVWLACGLAGLIAMWSSASDGGRLRLGGVLATLGSVAVVSTVVLAVLPAPHVAGRIDFPSAAGPGAPAARAGRTGRRRQGGATGQAGDRGRSHARGRLPGLLQPPRHRLARRTRRHRGHAGARRPAVVLDRRDLRHLGRRQLDRVTGPAQRPQRLNEDSPFILPGPPPAPATASTDLQTFYVVQSSPNLVFHADTAHEVWFPTHDLFVSDHDSIVSPIGLGPGAIYTVESFVTRTIRGRAAGRAGTERGPRPGPRPRIPRSRTPIRAPRPSPNHVTARQTTTYDKVQSLIAWIGKHTRYSTDIPPLAPGQDTVDQFLFGNRTGFCEQISTSLAVMLRSIGIPAREAVGYVPGPYNPITDLYDVQAQDAHAWVQVWFPGYGWQSFDPTAVVPLANPSPGSTLLARGHRRPSGGSRGCPSPWSSS